MDSTWLDYRLVGTQCSRCGADLEKSPQVRTKVYCASCRQIRRRASMRKASGRLRERCGGQAEAPGGSACPTNHCTSASFKFTLRRSRGFTSMCTPAFSKGRRKSGSKGV